MNIVQHVLLGFIAISTTSTFAQASFKTVGYLAGGNPISHARAVSSDGTSVVGVSTSGFAGVTGFQWSSSTGISMLPIIDGLGELQPGGFSRSGSLILGTTGFPGGGSQGFAWSESQGHTLFGDLPGGSNNSVISAINDDATYGIGRSSHGFSSIGAPIFHAVSWTPTGGLEPLQLPDPNDSLFNSGAYNMLSDGRIFGKSASGTWLYTSDTGSFEMLEGAEAMSRVSSDGDFFAGEATIGGGARAAYWTRDGGLAALPLLTEDDMFSNLRGMSDDGSIMVGRSVGTFGGENVLWIDQKAPITITDFATSLGIDMTGWRITAVSGVSGDGSTIVGTARHESWESGHLEGFILTIPAPGSASILGAALVAFRRRR